MAAKVGQLLIDIHANVAKLQKDMAKANSTMSGALSKMSSTLKVFGGAIAGAFAADKIFTFVDSAIDGADALGKMATRTGVAVETLSGLQHAANLSDTSIEEVGRSLGTLSQKMVDATNGSAEAARAFQQLGIDIQNSDGSLRDSEQVFFDLAERMSQMPDGAAKAGLAMKLMGESGAKLIPMLNNGRDGLEALKAEAESLGLVIGNDTARQAEAFNDNMARLSGVLTGVANSVIAEILPPLLSLTDRLIKGAKEGDTFAKTISTGFRIVATVGEVVWQIFNHIGKSIGALGAALVELVQGNFRNAYNIVKTADGEILHDWKGTFDAVGDLWTASEEPPKKAVEKTKKAVQTIPPALNKVAEEAKKTADAIAASLLRTAIIEADLADDRLEQVRLRYAAQIAELEKKIADEKIREEEKNAYLAELDAVQRQRDAELAETELQLAREHERQRRDVELETAAMRAELTESELDDLRVAHEQRLEALNRRLEDELITEQEHAEQRALLLQQYEQAVTAATKAETEKRMAEQIAIQKSAAQRMANAFGREFINPMSEGFLKLENLLNSISSLVMDIIGQVVTSGLVTALTGGAAGGGGLLGDLLGFSEGGPVRGPGGPTDDKIPALLSNEEFVIKAKSARKLGLPLLNWLNRVGDMPRPKALPAFAQGGPVGVHKVGTPMGGGPVTVAPQFVVQAGGGLLHRELLLREIGPVLRQMAIEQMDSIIRQLGLNPAVVSSRG